MADDTSITEKEKTASPYPIALFFPEIIPAGIFVLLAPYWGISLFIEGFIFQAAALFGSALIGVIVFVKLIRAGFRWGAHMLIVVLLCIVWVVNWSLPPGVGWRF